MQIDVKDPPRQFTVGTGAVRFPMSDCATVRLQVDEQVTFVAAAGAEYDVGRKDWGFYATPSLNGRLSGFGLRGVLARNRSTGRYFILLVQRGHEDAFNAYCVQETMAVVAWLDSTEALDGLAQALGATKAFEPVAESR